MFFVIATYAEIVGFSRAARPLGAQTFPIGTLAQLYGIGYLRLPVTIGALCSAFSVCLACITTAGRVAYAMGSTGFLPPIFARIEPRHATPNVAVTVVTALTLGVVLIALALRVTPDDIFNNCGTLSSFGFILIYALIAVAALVYSRRLGVMKPVDVAVSLVALAFLALTTVWLFDSVKAPPQRWFVYYFIAFLVLGWLGLRAFSARATRM